MNELRTVTEAEAKILDLAAELAARNPDAAAVLGRGLTHYAAQQKRWRGCGLVLRFNVVEAKAELIVGE